MRILGEDESAAYMVNDSMFTITKSAIIACIVAVAIFSNYIYGVSGVSYVDDALCIIIILWGVLSFIFGNPAYITKGYGAVWISFLIFLIISLIFLYQNFFSFVYEFYKLFIFLSFIPLLAYFSEKAIKRADEKILFIMMLLFGLNLLIITLQYLASPTIITYFGLPIEQITVSQKTGRWVGLFESVNSFGDAALLLYFLNEFIRPTFYKTARFIFFVSILTSTSKHAILLLMFMILILSLTTGLEKAARHHVCRYARVSLVIIVVGLIGCMAYFLNENAFNIKIEQYKYFLENASNITDSDAHMLEKRALNIGTGLSIFYEHPFGVGLGVWGDASSQFNDNNYAFQKIKMSDSSIIHLLVEQGVFVVFYIAVLISGFIVASRYGNRWYMLVLLSLLGLIGFVTMGLSSGGWPVLFAYIYARLIRAPRKLFSQSHCRIVLKESAG